MKRGYGINQGKTCSSHSCLCFIRTILWLTALVTNSRFFATFAVVPFDGFGMPFFSLARGSDCRDCVEKKLPGLNSGALDSSTFLKKIASDER